MKIVLTLLVVGFVLFGLTACGQQSAAMTSPVDVDIAVHTEPEPLTVGASTLIITLTDGKGSRIDGAKLQVRGNMDHAGMTPVDREVSDSANGEYRVPFEWTMGGGWIVTVTALLSNNGGEASDTFEFFVEAVSSESVINQPGDRDMTAEVTSDRAANTADMDVNIIYAPDHNPATVGEASVTITLTDTNGDPIIDAVVEVVGDMAHAGMMPISGTGAHTENGQYVVPLRWTMAGDWQVTAKVTLADDRQFEQSFDQSIAMQ